MILGSRKKVSKLPALTGVKSNVDQTPKQPEENDALWELLGKSRPPQASPFFAARVVNAVRSESKERFGFIRALFRPAIIGTAFAVFAVTTTLVYHSTTEKPLAEQDFDTIVELDNLIAMDQQNLWTDSSAYSNY